MPAGAKTTYIGIHGGTVPVSLLTAGDGSPMIALVGLTGSDFLNFLRTNDRLQEEPLFAGCTGLRRIEIPEGVTAIGRNAFEQCTSLTEAELGSGLTSIEISVLTGAARWKGL